MVPKHWKYIVVALLVLVVCVSAAHQNFPDVPYGVHSDSIPAFPLHPCPNNSLANSNQIIPITHYPDTSISSEQYNYSFLSSLLPPLYKFPSGWSISISDNKLTATQELYPGIPFGSARYLDIILNEHTSYSEAKNYYHGQVHRAINKATRNRLPITPRYSNNEYDDNHCLTSVYVAHSIAHTKTAKATSRELYGFYRNVSFKITSWGVTGGNTSFATDIGIALMNKLANELRPECDTVTSCRHISTYEKGSNSPLTLATSRSLYSSIVEPLHQPHYYNFVRLYHFANNTKKWYFYDIDPDLAGINTLQTVESGAVYWIKVHTDVIVTLNNKPRQLYSGWNLVAY